MIQIYDVTLIVILCCSRVDTSPDWAYIERVRWAQQETQSKHSHTEQM